MIKASTISKVRPSSNIEKLFLQLSEWDNELLLTPKMIILLARSLLKLHEPALSNVIPYPLYTLVAPNKKFLNLKLLVVFLGQTSKS